MLSYVRSYMYLLCIGSISSGQVKVTVHAMTNASCGDIHIIRQQVYALGKSR